MGRKPPSPRSRPACSAVDAGYPWMHQGICRSTREPFGIVRGMSVDTSDEFMWDIPVGNGKENLWVLAKGLGSLFAYLIVELIESSYIQVGLDLPVHVWLIFYTWILYGKQHGWDMFLLNKFHTVWLGFYPSLCPFSGHMGPRNWRLHFPNPGASNIKMCRVSMDNLKRLCGVNLSICCIPSTQQISIGSQAWLQVVFGAKSGSLM